jgi:hypothetical protein
MLTGFGGIMTAAGEMPEGGDFVASKPIKLATIREAVARVIEREPPRLPNRLTGLRAHAMIWDKSSKRKKGERRGRKGKGKQREKNLSRFLFFPLSSSSFPFQRNLCLLRFPSPKAAKAQSR